MPRRCPIASMLCCVRGLASGSTGRPKGVAMPHRPLAHLIAWQLAASAVGRGARTLQLATSASFDVAFQGDLCDARCRWLARPRAGSNPSRAAGLVGADPLTRRRADLPAGRGTATAGNRRRQRRGRSLAARGHHCRRARTASRRRWWPGSRVRPGMHAVEPIRARQAHARDRTPAARRAGRMADLAANWRTDSERRDRADRPGR